MPGLDDLRWTEYRDFTGGLWERGTDREVPSNGLLRCDDYYPLPTGGLRAGYRWETLVDSGLSAQGLPTSTHFVSGFGVFRIDRAAGVSRKYLALQSTSLNPGLGSFDLFGTTSTASTHSTVWTKVTSHSSMVAYQPTRIIQYTRNQAVAPIREYYHIGNAAGGQPFDGVYRLAEAGNAVDTRVSTGAAAFIVGHQNRLFSFGYRGHTGAAEAQLMQFSLPFEDTGMDNSTNRFVIAPQHPGDVCYAEPFYPGDLQVLKREWGWFDVQGEFPTPFVRQEPLVHPPQRWTWGAQTPMGLAYLTNDEGVWVHAGGNYPRHLSPQFVGTPMTELVLEGSSQPAFNGSMLFAASSLFTPKGYIWDQRTNAWWKSTPLNTSPPWPFFGYDAAEGQVFAARHTSAGAIQVLHQSIDEREMTRSLSGTVGLPLIYQDGTQTVLRELELHLQTFGPNSTVAVSLTRPDPAGGADITTTVPTKTLATVSRHKLRLILGLTSGSANADWWKVTIALSSPTVEAPMIERMLVGWQPGTRYGAA